MMSITYFGYCLCGTLVMCFVEDGMASCRASLMASNSFLSACSKSFAVCIFFGNVSVFCLIMSLKVVQSASWYLYFVVLQAKLEMRLELIVEATS